MITDNFKRVIAFYPHISSIDEIYNLVNTFGNTTTWGSAYNDISQSMNQGYNWGINANNVTSNPQYNIFTGSGTTTPTASDYTLETEVLLDYITGTISINGTTRVITHTLGNNSGNSVTINEVALTLTREGADRFMLDRTVLTNPVTIPDGSSYTFTYTLDFTNLQLQQ